MATTAINNNGHQVTDLHLLCGKCARPKPEADFKEKGKLYKTCNDCRAKSRKRKTSDGFIVQVNLSAQEARHHLATWIHKCTEDELSQIWKVYEKSGPAIYESIEEMKYG